LGRRWVHEWGVQHLQEDTFSIFVFQKYLMGIASIQTFWEIFEMLWVMVIVYVFKINIRGVCCDRIVIKDYLIVHENKL
jgi:hypothetical protein